MENVIAVEGLNFIPRKPIIPPAAINGIIVGNTDKMDNFTDLNKKIIDTKMIKMPK